jgi:hypothetical protein
MARPKLEITRDRQFNIGLTAIEYEALHRRAASAGMRPVDYARARLFSELFRSRAAAPAAHHLDPLVMVALSRIGNNLNQIAHKLNLRPEPAPPSLEPALRELRQFLRRAAGA